MVYVIDDAQISVGVVTIGWKAPYLQLVFVDEPYRRGDVGTKATSVVVDEFFQSRPAELWLGVTRPISVAGERLLRRLGFSSSGSGMRITRDAWEAGLPTVAQFFDPDRDRADCDHELEHDVSDTMSDDENDEDPRKVAIDAHVLHIVSDEDARARFHVLLGKGEGWKSELMKYRTTSDWQDDWVIEVGNWLARAQSMGYLDFILQRVQPQRTADGRRDEGDDVHRNVTQWLAQAMAAHYFLGIGWGFGAWEPRVTDLRGDGAPADIDLQLFAPSGGPLVDMQVKASGRLGLHDHEVDEQIRAGVRNAIPQLPDPPLGPALIVMCAQRDWPLSGYTHALEPMIGRTCGYPDGRVLLHDDVRGELAAASHVSGIAMLDYRRGWTSFDYGCSVLMNPWATYPLDPAWFPHSRVLSCTDSVFCWIRGTPSASTFPTGTRFARGPLGSAL